MIYDLVAKGKQEQENKKTKARNEVISEKEGKKDGDFPSIRPLIVCFRDLSV